MRLRGHGQERATTMNFLQLRAIIGQTKIAFFIFCALLLAGCATARQLQEFERTFDAPGLKILPVTRTAAGVDRADFKLRAARTDRIRIALSRRTESKTIPALLINTAFEKFQSLLAFKDVSLFTAPAGVLVPVEQADHREYLKSNQIDGVADVSLIERDAKNFALKLELRDPYTGAVITDLTQDFQIRERAVDPEHQLEFYSRGGTFAFLEGERSPQIVMVQPRPPEAMYEILTQTVTGKVNVSSSTTESEVYLWPAGNRRAAKKLGNTPVASFRLNEGRHTLEVRRRGFATQILPIVMRSGQDLDVAAPWPDDPKIQTATIVSAPAGIQLSMDGTVRGETPVYLTGLESGSYNLELARPTKDGNFEIVAEGALEIDEAEQPERLFIIDYNEDFSADVMQNDLWRLSSTKGKVAFKAGPGLALQNQGGDEETWQGLVSQPIYMEDFQMNTRVVEGDGSVLAFGIRSGDATVLVEVNNNVYTTAVYAPEQKPVFASFQVTVPSPDNSHFIRYKFNREKGVISVKLDGTTIYEGPFKPAATGRVLLLTRPTAADGRVLAKSFSMKSGRGLLDNRLLDLPFVNEAVDWVRAKWNRQ